MTDEQFLGYVAEIAARHNMVMPDDHRLFFAFCSDVLSRELALIDDLEREIDENESE